LSQLVSLCDAHGVTLFSDAESLDSSSPGWPIVLKMLSVVSERQREASSQRTAEGLRAKRNRRQIYGGIPYGLQLAGGGVTLEPCPPEQQMIDAAVRARRQGTAWREIAYALNEAGYRNRAGRPWILTNLRSAVMTAEKSEVELARDDRELSSNGADLRNSRDRFETRSAQPPRKTDHRPGPEDKASQQVREPRPICKTSIPGSNPGGASKFPVQIRRSVVSPLAERARNCSRMFSNSIVGLHLW
jgi:hypothetical protein